MASSPLACKSGSPPPVATLGVVRVPAIGCRGKAFKVAAESSKSDASARTSVVDFVPAVAREVESTSSSESAS
jgi:hypothetical protein